MAEIALLACTGHEPIDRALRGIVGAYEAAFPGRVRGYYLLGSYAEGNAVAVSDVDANVLFADAFVDAAERERAEALRRACDGLSPVRLDLLVRDERSMHPLDVRLATNAVLLYGEDTRARLPLPDRLT